MSIFGKIFRINNNEVDDDHFEADYDLPCDDCDEYDCDCDDGYDDDDDFDD